MTARAQRRVVVIVYLAGGVAAVGLLIAYVVATRQPAAPSTRRATQQVVTASRVRVNDWLGEHGRVTSVESLEAVGVLVRTANHLIVYRPDDEVVVLRRRAARSE
ncbi:MAG TPA: hypothetical protein PK020_07525 [Ilumatobacteraceae bacterium]|nr:hypothetical protein [Ilumatobacteraceae bacterium]HRB03857.1 hypothetical protein [Ilumatobacteraceae bacterium]